MNDEVAKYPESFLHDLFTFSFKPRKEAVLLDFHFEAEFLHYAPYENSSPYPARVIRCAPFEAETDVILQGPFAHKGFDSRKMEPEPGGEATKILGNHEIVSGGVG